MRRPQRSPLIQDRVPPDRDADDVLLRRRFLLVTGRARCIAVAAVGRSRRCRGTEQITADTHVVVDHAFPREDNVLRAVQLGPSGDFVAGFGGDVG